MMAGLDVQAATSELIAIRPATGSRKRRTRRDYVLPMRPERSRSVTFFLIAQAVAAATDL